MRETFYLGFTHFFFAEITLHKIKVFCNNYLQINPFKNSPYAVDDF